MPRLSPYPQVYDPDPNSQKRGTSCCRHAAFIDGLDLFASSTFSMLPEEIWGLLSSFHTHLADAEKWGSLGRKLSTSIHTNAWASKLLSPFCTVPRLHKF